MIPGGDEPQCEPGWKPLAKGGLRDCSACFVYAGAGGRRPGEGKGHPGSCYWISETFTIGCPWFRPVILALPGPLIPRVIFVLEGWTSASLNLSVLPCLSCPACPALPVLPHPSCLCPSLHVSSLRTAGHQVHVPKNPQVPEPYRVATTTHNREARYPRRRACTSDSGGFINGDDILGGPGLDLLGPKLGHSDDGQALPAVLSNFFLNG